MFCGIASCAGDATVRTVAVSNTAEERLPQAARRPSVRGKFVVTGAVQFYARGVTYGPFRPDEAGCCYHTPEVARRDFAAMRAHGINAVRTYTAPPTWLLDVAREEDLRVLVGVGLAGEQLAAFLDDRRLLCGIRRRCREEVRRFAGHPALLAYVIGNEIPGPIVRWHGRRRVESFLTELYDLTRQEDPGGLTTYVNYPTTEYLQLPFLDFHSYNVYLESDERLTAYLSRLQNLCGDKPLVLAEIGLDSMRNGMRAQARSVERQIRTAFAAGCAGAFVFAWTDEWHTGGVEIDNWKFGITDGCRRPKPALSRVRRAFEQVPFPRDGRCAKASVVVCTRNGSRTISKCLEALGQLEYPNYEVIVVDDGSSDSTADLVRKYPVRLVSTENRGLSSARNTGMRAATGEIIAYIDDDAWPDSHWLSYLVHTLQATDHAAAGGPNLVPPDDGPVAQCVAHAPGGPTHVLLTDQIAEHIPGCNMAFRTERLREIGGFDRQFRIAGDDVDVCWRLQQKGHTLGFHPAAVVWHHRRNSVRSYLRQQLNYGRAEAMLESKWPQKYNAVGHVTWRGRMYGGGRALRLWPSRIYYGVWCSQPFQSLYTPAGAFDCLPLMPEWYLLAAALAATAALGALWPPLLVALPIAVLLIALSLTQALRAAFQAPLARGDSVGRARRMSMRLLTAYLHLLQPTVRLWGRISYGLTPWRRHRRLNAPALPLAPLSLRRTDTAWSEKWESAEQRLILVEQLLREEGVPLRRGGDFDAWDLEVRGGLLARARTRMAIEEYPLGRQLVRFRSWTTFSGWGLLAMLLFGGLALGAASDRQPLVAGILGAIAILTGLRLAGDAATAMSSLAQALGRYGELVQGSRKTGPTPARKSLLTNLEQVAEVTTGSSSGSAAVS